MAESSKQTLLRLFADAAVNGNVNEVRRLVRSEGVDPNATFPFVLQNATTALHVACEGNDIEVAQYLVEEAHCDVERQDQYGRTALHVVCSFPMVRYLVETGGANVEARSNDGWTPLHSTSMRWKPGVYLSIVEYLVGQQQANVDAKNAKGFTPLDVGIIEEVSEDIIRFLLPRTSSIAKEALVSLWKRHLAPEIKKEKLRLDILSMVLEKYASGHGLSSDFKRFPIHNLVSHFPLPSTKAFQESVALFPTSALSLLDAQGKLPIHVALLSTNDQLAGSPSQIVSFLFDREPRSALVRDSVTGLYPHETAASLVSREDDDDDDDVAWLDIVFKMFRSNPQQVLQSRQVGGVDASTLLLGRSEGFHDVVDKVPLPKRAKIDI